MKKIIIIVLFSVVLVGGFLYYVIFKERWEQTSLSEQASIWEQEIIRDLEGTLDVESILELESTLRDTNYVLEWVERLELLYSDETFAQLGDFFETIQGNFEYFLNHLYENNLFDDLSQVLIDFPLTEQEAMLDSGRNVNDWRGLVIYNDEIIPETSAEHLVDFFENYHELLSIIKDMGEYGIVLRVSISSEEDRGIRVRFTINPAHTEFTERLVPGIRNYFIYITGIESERILAENTNRRSITGNWYMQIGQKRFNSESSPIPLED